MSLLLNLIWVIFGGFELFLSYIGAGLVGFIFIITIPMGIAAWRIAWFVLWPFGRAVIKKPGAGTGSAIMNFVWFFIAGLWLAIAHVITAIVQALTIVGIPLAIANIKLIPITCFPFGKEVVSDADIRAGANVVYVFRD